jgi:hypothetical protein
MVRKAKYAVAAAVLAAATAGGPAAADEIRIDRPMVDGVPVDWCRSFGQGCGWDGAHAFCHDRGYERALRFQIFAPGRTYLTGADAFCTGPTCTAFLSVTCKMAPGQSADLAPPTDPADAARPARVRFDHPRNDGIPADWCSFRGLDCGWGGAHKFCEARGFDRAIDWSSYRPGATRVVGEAAPCRGPTCVGLRHVVCDRHLAAREPEHETPAPPMDSPHGHGPPDHDE